MNTQDIMELCSIFKAFSRLLHFEIPEIEMECNK